MKQLTATFYGKGSKETAAAFTDDKNVIKVTIEDLNGLEKLTVLYEED